MSKYGKERAHGYAERSVCFGYPGYHPPSTAAYFELGWCAAHLHQECVDAVGRGSKLQYRLLPAHVLLVANLDATNLQHALRRLNGIGRDTPLEFRVTPMSRFDAVLIPVGVWEHTRATCVTSGLCANPRQVYTREAV